MANLASGLTPIEKEIWSNPSEATNGNVSVYDGQTGFASVKHPNNYTLDLGKAQSIGTIRFLLWDGLGQPNTTRNPRKYSYRLFTSEDGKKWEFVWGTGHNGFNGWQVFEFQSAQKARFVRLECLHNTENPAFHIVEFEVHDTQPNEVPADRITNRQYISDSLQPLRNKVNELVSSMEGRSKDIATFRQNANDWSKDIENVHTRLKEQEKSIDEVVASFNEASKQLETIRADYATVSGNAEQSQTFLASVAEAQKEVTRLKTEIQQERTEVTGLIDRVREFHAKTFTPLQDQITQLQTTATDNATKAIHAAGQAEEFKNQGETALQGIQQALQQSQDRFGSLEKVAEDVQAIYDRATNLSDGIPAKVAQVNELKGQLDELSGAIKSKFDTASKLTDEVIQFHAELDKAHKQILIAEKSSVDTEAKISELYKTVMPKFRGGRFDETRKEFFAEQKKWLTYVVLSSVLTSVTAVLVYKFAGGTEGNIGALIVRYATLSPLIFLIAFCSKQYAFARASYEKYSFKTVVAVSIDADLAMMQQRFKDSKAKSKDEELLKFYLSTLTNLYREPYFDETRKRELDLAIEQVRYGFKTEVENANQKDAQIPPAP